MAALPIEVPLPHLFDASPHPAKIRGLLAPFVLRRLKSQVLNQLVPKTNHVERLTPTAFQKEVYNNILERHVERQRQRAGGAADVTSLVGSDKDAQNVFVTLRKVSEERAPTSAHHVHRPTSHHQPPPFAIFHRPLAHIAPGCQPPAAPAQPIQRRR